MGTTRMEARVDQLCGEGDYDAFLERDHLSDPDSRGRSMAHELDVRRYAEAAVAEVLDEVRSSRK